MFITPCASESYIYYKISNYLTRSAPYNDFRFPNNFIPNTLRIVSSCLTVYNVINIVNVYYYLPGRVVVKRERERKLLKYYSNTTKRIKVGIYNEKFLFFPFDCVHGDHSVSITLQSIKMFNRPNYAYIVVDSIEFEFS